jgi:hypothetical protein
VKTSWVIFVVIAYIAIFYFAGIMEQTNLITSTSTGQVNLQAMGQPTGTNFGVGLTSQIVLVWNYMVNLIYMVFLWNPTVWSGNWIWFYYIVCLPICIGVVFSIVTIMRGSHSS